MALVGQNAGKSQARVESASGGQRETRPVVNLGAGFSLVPLRAGGPALRNYMQVRARSEPTPMYGPLCERLQNGPIRRKCRTANASRMRNPNTKCKFPDKFERDAWWELKKERLARKGPLEIARQLHNRGKKEDTLFTKPSFFSVYLATRALYAIKVPRSSLINVGSLKRGRSRSIHQFRTCCGPLTWRRREINYRFYYGASFASLFSWREKEKQRAVSFVCALSSHGEITVARNAIILPLSVFAK